MKKLSVNNLWCHEEIEVMLLWLTGTPIDEIAEQVPRLTADDVRIIVEAYVLNDGKRNGEDEGVWVKLSDVYDAREGKIDVRGRD